MSNARDRQLARRVLRKDEGAFDEFFGSLFPRVYRFCRARTHDEAEVEDIVQETMLKALRSLNGYRGEASLFTWMCQICRHEIAARRRRLALDGQAVEGFDEAAGTGSADVSDLFERFSVEESVHLALDRLPVEYAAALEQKYLMGRTVAEVASHLGRSRIATQSLLARARRAFVRCYRELHEGEGGRQ